MQKFARLSAKKWCKFLCVIPELARVTNSARLFTPGETKALAESKVHQISRAWVTNDGWSSSLISKVKNMADRQEWKLERAKIQKNICKKDYTTRRKVFSTFR